MADNKINKLLVSSKSSTTNTLLSTNQTKSSLLTSSNLRSSLLEKNLLIDDRKKKLEEKIEFIENKKPKLLLTGVEKRSSIDTTNKTAISTSNLALKSQTLTNNLLTKFSTNLDTSSVVKPFSTAFIKSHVSHTKPVTLKTTNNLLLDSKKENLENYITKEKSTIAAGVNFSVSNTVISTTIGESKRPIDIRNIFEDLTNSKAYLDLVNTINNQNKKFDEETKSIDEKELQFNGFPDPRRQLLKGNFELVKLKNLLINLVSSSLLRAPNFKDAKDQTRNSLIEISRRIIPFDGEFILKLALYTRKELNIRVTANFLLALASFHEECRKYLSRYYSTSVALPSDWIDIAEQYQIFSDKRIRFGALPSALRKTMVEKFPGFDEYQLAKYNKDKAKKNDGGLLKDVKHVKAKLKFDEKGNEIQFLVNEESPCEDKYVKTLKQGLTIRDYVEAQLLVQENCKLLKIDLVAKKVENKNESKRIMSKRGGRMPVTKKDEKPEESVPLRFGIDYAYNRVTKKTFSNKTWSKADVKMNNVAPILDINNKNSNVKITILVNASNFEIKVDDKIVTTHDHSKHNIELSKINCVRISGIDIKLNALTVENADKINHDENETEEEIKQRTFTLKQLIRQLHISKPIQHVFGLLGKKYPATYEEYLVSGLPGIFDSDKAGKRMRLAIPETWETQISMKGNKAYVWEQLIDNKKLPYMAMLRNLRNMIKSGIDEKHHQWVIKKLQDEGAVINSKQFPINFFSAYDVIDELQNDFREYLKWAEVNENNQTFNAAKNQDKKARQDAKKYKDMGYDEEILKRYKKAIDNALKVATTYNISPIKGKTLVFVSRNNYDGGLECKTARIGKSKRSVSEISALLGLMFKYSCEDSRLLLFSSSIESSSCTEVELQQGTILDNMKVVTSLNIGYNQSTVSSILSNLISNRVLIDNLIIISQKLADNSDSAIFLNRFLSKYRVCVNDRLLFVNVDLGATDTRLMLNNQVFVHENDVTINGYSDSILRFVAERGNQGQLIHIENIDKSYELPEIKNSKASKEEEKMEISLDIEKPFPILNEIPKWITTKVFISSTFRDMHTERDILSRVVFPVLKSKLSQRYINVYEVDLRWGITESEANEDKTLDLCLKQVLECDFFIGMLGERYGQIPSTYHVTKNPKLKWLEEYPEGASITELEIQCAAFEKYKNERQKALERSFFYFRDGSLISDIPEGLRYHFESENTDAKYKLDSLKDKIKLNGFEVFEGYKSEWLGIDENGRALLTKIDDFAQRVFNNLLNAITMAYPHDKQSNLDEYSHSSGLHDSYIKTCSDQFIGRRKLIENCEKLVKDQMVQYNFKENKPHVLLVDGDAGVGKTSFICCFTQYLREITTHVFAHIVNACPGSEHTIGFLKRFTVEIIRNYSLTISETAAKEANDLKVLKRIFNDILNELKNLISDKFIIVIDGVDLLLDGNGVVDESLSWLPEKIPANITIIMSSRNTSRIQEVLNKRVQSFNKKENKEYEFHYDKFSIPELVILEKSQIVRQKLDVYNKKLDETGFNNQMKLITNKRDAGNPLYLALACEELRFHNNYETLNDKLKDMPQKLAALVPYVLYRLENDYGASYTSSAFLFLLCSKEGLKEYELKKMLDLQCYIEECKFLETLERADSITEIKKRINISIMLTSPIASNSEGKFLSFIESISETFLRPFSNNDSGNLRIKLHPTIDTCLRLKFTKTSIAIENANKLMSLYYWLELDKDLGFNWSTKNTRAYTYLPYYLSMGNNISDLLDILSDLKFLAAKSILGLSAQLLEDYELHGNKKMTHSNFKGKNNSQLRFNEYKRFFSENYHIISKSPTLIFQQAMNQPPKSAPYEDLKSILLDKQVTLMFEETNKETIFDEIMSKVLPLTIKEFNSPISSIVISPNGQYIACGTEDCEIRIFSASTAALVKKLHGHSGKINDLCFVGSDTLCSTSSDGLASLWNVSGGYRIKILNKHNGHVVSACSAEPNGKFLVTVGWDCTVKIWNSSDGNLSGEIRGHGRPINCVAYHPDGNIIATGCWDSCIRLLDVFNRQRKAVFRGQSGSIRSITFSKNGVYIASSSINGDVSLWHASNGSQVGVFQGHTLPVNCLKYSPTSEVLATGSSDRKIKLWPGTTGKCIKLIKDDKIPISSVCFKPKSDKSIAVGYHTGEVRVYDLNNINNPVKWRPHSAVIRRIKFNHEAKFLVSVAENGTAAISSTTGNLIAELLGHSGSINGLDISKMDTIVTGCEDASIRIFEFDSIDSEEADIGMFLDDNFTAANTSTPVVQDNAKKDKMTPVITLNKHTSPVTACSFNSYGTKFVSASKDATLIFWSYQHYSKNVTADIIINAAHPDWITDCYWSPSADFILTCSNDFTMKVFDATTGKHKSTMTGHSSSINTCNFQYGCAISTSSDGSAKVWSHKGYEITTLLGHQSRVNGCDMFVKLKSTKDKKSNKAINKDDDEESVDYAPIQNWAEYMDEAEQQKQVESSRIDKNTHKLEKLTVVTVSDDCSIRVWYPLESDDLLCLEGHNDKIESLALGANNIMCTASADRSVKIWNLSNFFSNYTSGKIIHGDKTKKGHNAEITKISSNNNETILLTISRDGIMIVWKANYNNKKLINIDYLNEFEVHSACCNDICIISENEAKIELATCSDDKKIIIWELNISNLNSISLKNKQQIYQQRQVIALMKLTRVDKKKKLNNILMSIDTINSTMMVNFYDIDKSYKKFDKSGCLLSGYGTFIYDIKILTSDLFISLVNSYVIKLSIEELISTFKNYHRESEQFSKDREIGKIVPKDEVEVRTEEDRIWYTCVVESDTEKTILASDFKGNLHRCAQNNNKFEFVKKVHDTCITDMILAKNGNNTRLITASKDGVLKIWTENAEKQLGQYNFNLGITNIKCIKSDSETNQINIICADQAGDIRVLVWHD